MSSTASPIQEFRFEEDVDLMATAALRHTVWILRGNPLTAVAASGVLLLVLIAIFGPSIVPYDPIASKVSEALLPPSAAHWPAPINSAAIPSAGFWLRPGLISSSRSRPLAFRLCSAPS
jgi:ABC-type dipeptide/oligopeptide/nickel transport system permease subunit